MRILHQLYRHKNPAPRRLTGARRDLHADLMALMRRPNPLPARRGGWGGILERGIVPDPKMTQTIAQKWRAALSKLEDFEREHARQEGVTRAERKIAAWKSSRISAEDPRRKILHQAAQQEIEIRSAGRKQAGKKPFSEEKKRQMILEMTQSSAAKWNLLGELNRQIALGNRDLTPLRNVISAEIEGHLSGPALEYSLEQALSQLTALEIRELSNLLDQGIEAGEARARVAAMPGIREAARRVERAEGREREGEEIVRKAMARGRMGRSQLLLDSELLARKEAKDFTKTDPLYIAFSRKDIPSDKELWDKVVDQLYARSKKLKPNDEARAKKIVKIFDDYANIIKSYAGIKELKAVPYLPPSFVVKAQSRVEDQIRTEEGRIAALLDDEVAKRQLEAFREGLKRDTGAYPKIDSVSKYRDFLARRLYSMVVTRWRNALMLEYERRGGKYLTPFEIKTRERALKKELGAGFEMSKGLYGIVEKTDGDYRWKVFTDDGKALMWGQSPTHATASRQLAIADRVVYSLLGQSDEKLGFDYLPSQNRRWLSSNLPNVSISMKRILLASAGERVDLDAKVMRWLASEDVLGEDMEIYKHGQYLKSKDCHGMKPGERRVVGIKGAKLYVERGKTREVYKAFIVSKSGVESAVYRFDHCNEVLARASMISGALAAGKKVIGAVGNPSSMLRLESNARKKLEKMASKKKRGRKPKKNPRLPRRPVEVGAIEDLSGMIGLPSDPEDAYRLGYYAGIIRGIDTCGIQNYIRRKKLRKEFEQKLLDAAVSQQETLTGRVDRGRRGTTSIFY